MRQLYRITVTVLCCTLIVLAGCLAPVSPEPTSHVSDRTTDPTTGVSLTSSDTSNASRTSGGSEATRTETVRPATPRPATRPTVTVRVVSVVDGDTIHVEYPNGTQETVRLLGVDTPEVHGSNHPEEFRGVPDTDAGKACLREWGGKARAYARERLAGKTIRLGFDPRETGRGYYGRLLAYVYVDGHQFDYRLIARGYARVYEDSRFVERPRYEAAARNARTARKGLWTCVIGDPERTGGTGTSVGTTDASGLVVADVHEDASGPDGDNLDDEYVVFENGGETGLDLSGWTVADAVGHTYTVPDGTTLDTGDRLTLHTGTGRDGSSDLYWNAESPIWNNDGDTVTVSDRSGTLVLHETYD